MDGVLVRREGVRVGDSSDGPVAGFDSWVAARGLALLRLAYTSPSLTDCGSRSADPSWNRSERCLQRVTVGEPHLCRTVESMLGQG